jgi:hypothetical protein
MCRKRKSKKWKRKKLMSLIKSKSFESTLCSEEESNDVLYLGDRAASGANGGGSGTSLNGNNRSSGSKLSIRRRRKNHSRSSSSIVE